MIAEDGLGFSGRGIHRLEFRGNRRDSVSLTPEQMLTPWHRICRHGCEPLRRCVGFHTVAVRRSSFVRFGWSSAERILSKTC